MASAPNHPNLPIFFKDLLPLSTQEHATWKARALDKAPFLVNHHAVPLTSDEFISASRFYPIVFSAGDNPVPLALMGLNEGINTFVDAEGALLNPVYVPAYIRRYPFLLAKLRPDQEDLSLCFDPTSGAIGDFDDGDPLFVDGQPSEHTKAILGFCEQFEQAGQRTGQFMEELIKSGLLMDGEVSIEVENAPQPFVYRGFRMVDETKLRELRGDVLRKMMQNGMLALIFAHLFSLQLMREIFSAQVNQGKMPQIPEVAGAN